MLNSMHCFMFNYHTIILLKKKTHSKHISIICQKSWKFFFKKIMSEKLTEEQLDELVSFWNNYYKGWILG